MGQLTGTTALVSGASTGIGLAAAQRLAAEGAHVSSAADFKGALAGTVPLKRLGDPREVANAVAQFRRTPSCRRAHSPARRFDRRGIVPRLACGYAFTREDQR
jgi:NAD(P)-dependent dehydrogenase (short-subunit alcohol dehydrogenase family)